MKEFWKKLMTSGVVIAIVSIAAVIMVRVIKMQEAKRIAEKNLRAFPKDDKAVQDQIQREKDLDKEIIQVQEYQAEEVVDAWKAKFGA